MASLIDLLFIHSCVVLRGAEGRRPAVVVVVVAENVDDTLHSWCTLARSIWSHLSSGRPWMVGVGLDCFHQQGDRTKIEHTSLQLSGRSNVATDRAVLATTPFTFNDNTLAAQIT
jgi:hypothetical protein